MSLGEYLLLAVASIFWPLLFAIVVVALRTQHAVKLLSAFLAAGLFTTITIGVAIVFTLDGTSFVSGSRPTADPVVDIAVGVLAIVAAYVLNGFRRERKPAAKKPSRTEHYLANARLAFLAGIVLNLVPGLFPFVALKNIAEGDYADSTKVLLVVVFYLIMFSSVELPIAGHLVAPVRTAVAVQRFNDWLDRNGRTLGVWVLAVGGAYLIVRGLLRL